MSREAGAQAQLEGPRLEGELDPKNPDPAAPKEHGAPGAGPAPTNVPSGSVGGVLSILSERHVIRSLLAATAAWATTIAPAAFARGTPTVAALLATAALFAAIAGPIIAHQRRRLGRHIGISVFLVLATATWLSASLALQPARLDPTRAAIGAVAWAVFALSWSNPWKFRRPPATEVGAPALQARATLP